MSFAARNVSVRIVACLVATVIVAVQAVAAPTVWSGPTISFSKAGGADHTLPANQDHLTPNVALARGNSQGMFNILQESGYTGASPADTEWATAINNPGDVITASNYSALDFTTWTAAYGNQTSANILNYDAVVHLVTDDVYLDLRFTSFQGGGGGGGFAYERSTAVPEPASLLAAAVFGLMLLPIRRR
jgi:hypothetical protein